MPDGPLLSRPGFDRVAHRRTDEAWLAQAWSSARVLAVTPKSATAATRTGAGPRIAFRRADDIAADAPRRLLGVVDAVPYFSATVDPSADSSADPGADFGAGPSADTDAAAADGHTEWLTLRDLGTVIDDIQAGLLTAAIALEQWHQRHTHCPLCGTPTVEANAGWTRRCPNDGSDHFPRTDPAVIMLVHDGAGRALLGRGHQWGEGRFSTLAGFVEPGESLEAAVAREVFEEVGVRVSDIRYVGSQPWPFPASLMVGFTARLDGDPSIALDPTEMAEAAWFTRDEIRQAAAWADTGEEGPPTARIRGVSPKLSISRYLVDLWLDEVDSAH